MSTTRIRTVFQTPVPEKTNRTYGTTLTIDGVPAALAAITEIKATLIDVDSGYAFRTSQDVRNANGGTMDATSGAFSLNLTPTDNTLRDSTKSNERRLLTLYVKYNAGQNEEYHEVLYTIENLTSVS